MSSTRNRRIIAATCGGLPCWRVEYSVTVPVSVDAAFHAFQDLERLLHRGIYDEASWTEGAPWQVGSRLRYVVVRPVRATVSAVVTSISPPRTISLLNHALGVTAEQHVSFGPDLRGGTRVRMTMDLVGKSSELSESAVHEAITFFTNDALDTVVALCRHRLSFGLRPVIRPDVQRGRSVRFLYTSRHVQRSVSSC